MVAPLATAAVVLAAAIFWSGLDWSRKALAGRLAAEPLLVGLTLAPLPLFLGWYVWEGGGSPSSGYWAPGLGSVALNCLANIAFLRALAVSPLSVTVPLLSLTPAFTAVLAVPMLGERPGLLQTVGILAVVTGAFLITLQQGDSPAVVFKAFRREPGAMLMAGVAFLWSIALPLDKLAIQQAPAPFHAAMLNGGVAALVLVRLLVVGRVGELRGLRHVGPAFITALLCSFGGLSFQLLAIQRAPVGVVETVKRGLGSAMALLVGRAVFAERLPPHRIAAAFLMAGGVACILM